MMNFLTKTHVVLILTPNFGELQKVNEFRKLFGKQNCIKKKLGDEFGEFSRQNGVESEN